MALFETWEHAINACSWESRREGSILLWENNQLTEKRKMEHYYLVPVEKDSKYCICVLEIFTITKVNSTNTLAISFLVNVLGEDSPKYVNRTSQIITKYPAFAREDSNQWTQRLRILIPAVCRAKKSKKRLPELLDTWCAYLTRYRTQEKALEIT